MIPTVGKLLETERKSREGTTRSRKGSAGGAQFGLERSVLARRFAASANASGLGHRREKDFYNG